MALAYFETTWNTAGTAAGGDSFYKDLVITGVAAGDMLVVHGGSEYTTPATRSIVTTAGSTTAWTSSIPTIPFGNTDAIAGWARVTAGTSVTVRVTVACSGTYWMGACAVVIPAAEHNGSASPTFTTIINDSDGLVSVNPPAVSTVTYGACDYASSVDHGAPTPAGGTVRRNTRYSGHYIVNVFTWTGQATGARNYGPTSVSGKFITGIAVAVPEPAASIAGPKVWTGAAWAKKPAKVWNGSAWVEKPFKTWTGSTWKTLT